MVSQRLLQDNASVLQIPPLSGALSFECPFNFLYCTDVFSDFEDWYNHSLGHFENAGPPNRTRCCFCEYEFVGPYGWRQRLQHIADHHRVGHRLSHAQPDFELYDYLWNKGIISEVEYKALRGPKPATGYQSQSRIPYQSGSANMLTAYTMPHRSTRRPTGRR